MEEQERSVLAWHEDRWVILGLGNRVRAVLAVGELVELLVAGSWQQARVCSGGISGLYYEVLATGERGRFAISLGARLPLSSSKEVSSEHTMDTSLALVVAPTQGSPLVAGAARSVLPPVESVPALRDCAAGSGCSVAPALGAGGRS